MVLIPAFVVSGFTEAFQIGFIIFLPFLVIDMVVSNILMALGMQMLSPTTISLLQVAPLRPRRWLAPAHARLSDGVHINGRTD